MNLHFRDPKKELPEEGYPVLIKYSYKGGPGNNFTYEGYYVCYIEKRGSGDHVFIEAEGEQYAEYPLHCVVGRLPTKELAFIPCDRNR